MSTHTHTSNPCTICGHPLTGQEATDFVENPKKTSYNKIDWDAIAAEQGLRSGQAYKLLFDNHRHVSDESVVTMDVGIEAVKIAETNMLTETEARGLCAYVAEMRRNNRDMPDTEIFKQWQKINIEESDIEESEKNLLLPDLLKKVSLEIEDSTPTTIEELEEFRIRFLGKNGRVRFLFSKMQKHDTSVRGQLNEMIINIKYAAENKLEIIRKSLEKL